jgi:hypothetical protein
MGQDHITVQASDLKRLLLMTQRKQTVAGKNNPQVTSCMLTGDCFDGRYNLNTVSLVRDGRTSVSSFNVPMESCSPTSVQVPIPDIDRALGVLKAHSGLIKLTWTPNSIKIKSSNKQTTLTANANALAFAHSTETIVGWYKKSTELMGKVGTDEYHANNGDTIPTCYSLQLPASELADAFACDNINGQKLNRYTFTIQSGKCPTVSVGDPMKGQTEIQLTDEAIDLGKSSDFTWSFEGGLDYVVSLLSGNVWLKFLDFRKYEQGIRLLLVGEVTGEDSHIHECVLMQAGVL